MYTSAEGKEPCITTSRFLSSSSFFFFFLLVKIFGKLDPPLTKIPGSAPVCVKVLHTQLCFRLSWQRSHRSHWKSHRVKWCEYHCTEYKQLTQNLKIYFWIKLVCILYLIIHASVIVMSINPFIDINNSNENGW